jgi:hypothetical protein
MLTAAAFAFPPIVLSIYLAENLSSLCLLDTLQFSSMAGNDKSFAIYAFLKLNIISSYRYTAFYTTSNLLIFLHS